MQNIFQHKEVAADSSCNYEKTTFCFEKKK